MWEVLGVLLAMAVSGLLYTSVFFMISLNVYKLFKNNWYMLDEITISEMIHNFPYFIYTYM